MYGEPHGRTGTVTQEKIRVPSPRQGSGSCDLEEATVLQRLRYSSLPVGMLGGSGGGADEVMQRGGGADSRQLRLSHQCKDQALRWTDGQAAAKRHQ